MTQTSQQTSRNRSIDPFLCRDRAAQMRSQELAMMTARLLRALGEVLRAFRSPAGKAASG